MKIYVACLESYNEGNLVGEWVDPADYDDVESFGDHIDSIIRGEEWAVHDYDECPRELADDLGEYPDVEHLYNSAVALRECIGEFGWERVYASFSCEAVDPYYQPPEEWLDAIGDRSCYVAESIEDLVQEFAVETGMIKADSPLWGYIDWDLVQRDLEMDHSFVKVGDLWFMISSY